MNQKIDKLKKSKHKKNFFHNQQQQKKTRLKLWEMRQSTTWRTKQKSENKSISQKKVLHHNSKTKTFSHCKWLIKSIKMSDIGISTLMNIEMQSVTCKTATLKFIDLELIDVNDKSNENVDVYSFWVLIFFMKSWMREAKD